MNDDIETVRRALRQGYEAMVQLVWASDNWFAEEALDRLKAEVESLRPDAEAWRRTVEDSEKVQKYTENLGSALLESRAEVERLQRDRDSWKIHAGAVEKNLHRNAAENEGLRKDLRDERMKSWALEGYRDVDVPKLEAEIERLQKPNPLRDSIYQSRIDQLEQHGEGYRAEIERLLGAEAEHKYQYDYLVELYNETKAEVQKLRAALEELAHPTMDFHELSHLSDMQQVDIETARVAIAGQKT